jgi:hypothetical protein
MTSNYKTHYKNSHKSVNIDQVLAGLEEGK